MADPRRRLPGNAAGDWFVDARCIDCDACRQLAPAVFSAYAGQSVVRKQPETAADQRSAARALFACPTGSIGLDTSSADSANRFNSLSFRPQGGIRFPAEAIRSAIDDFPLQLEDGVYYCGFNSEKSYGGNSYFIRHAAGNWLIDSPRFTHHLVDKIKQSGGLAYIFLTHRDDVADAAKYAREFGAKRIMHRLERHAQPDSEIIIDGTEPVTISPEFVVIPTPGHTRGHCCLLVRDRFLFTGDHLDWDRDARQLDASPAYCWYSWPQQVESIERLLAYSFEWILPGHGERVKLAPDVMRKELERLLARIRHPMSAE